MELKRNGSSDVFHFVGHQEEIEALESIISLAQQAEYQYPDVKIEPLRTLLENITAQKRIAKSLYSRSLLRHKAFSRTIDQLGLQGLYSHYCMDTERNDVLTDFEGKPDIGFYDAGGED